MEEATYISDIDRLPGFVQKNGKYGKLRITKDGNEWVIKYSNFNTLISSNLSFQEAFDDILIKIRDGNYEY